MKEDLAEHIKKLHLEKDDVIIVSNPDLLKSFDSVKLDHRNWIIYAPDCDIKKCKIEDLRKVVEAYDQALS